jgi:hypothetical protein
MQGRAGTLIASGKAEPMAVSKQPNDRSPLPKPLPPPVAGPGASTSGTPVNPFSRAVHPKHLYPVHFDLLMRHLYQQGLVPERWLVVAADESRLDEFGMDVDFTLTEHGSDKLHRCRVEVQQGKLQRISFS